MRLIAAAVSALVILGVAATTASSSTGDPVIAGQANSSNAPTQFYGTAPPCDDCTGVPTVGVSSLSPDRIGLAVQGGTVLVGGLTLKNGVMTMESNAFVLGVAAGKRKAVSSHDFDVPVDAMVLANLQSPRPNLWVTAAVPQPGSPGTVTVYLNRVVQHPVRLTVAVIGSAG